MTSIYAIYAIIIGGIVISEIQAYQDAIAAYIANKAKKRVKSKAQQFFDAEAGLNVAMEKFGDFAVSLGADVTTAVVYNTIKDPTSSADPAAQRVVAEITLRPIQSDITVATTNGQPAQSHQSTPPAGSSSGVNSTVTRRYSINSVAGDKELQIGVYRIVPK